jgi:hypothetical protein
LLKARIEIAKNENSSGVDSSHESRIDGNGHLDLARLPVGILEELLKYLVEHLRTAAAEAREDLLTVMIAVNREL